MPCVNLQITRGATREQKEALIAEFTGALVRILGKRPEHTHVIIQEIAEENWGFAGMLTDTYRETQQHGEMSRSIKTPVRNRLGGIDHKA